MTLNAINNDGTQVSDRQVFYQTGVSSIDFGSMIAQEGGGKEGRVKAMTKLRQQAAKQELQRRGLSAKNKARKIIHPLY